MGVSPTASMSGASSQQTNDAIRVMVVDDALVIRGMLTRFLEESGDISVVASVGDGERALAAWTGTMWMWLFWTSKCRAWMV